MIDWEKELSAIKMKKQIVMHDLKKQIKDDKDRQI